MVRVDYISDLHMGFVIGNKRSRISKVIQKVTDYVEGTLPETSGDFLVVAGDVDEYNSNIVLTLEEYAKHYDKVFFVYGNHDLYTISNTQQNMYKKNAYNRQEELVTLVNESPYGDKITILNNDVVEHKGLTIAGTTLWYTLPLTYDQQWWFSNSNDSKYILPRGVYATEERSKKDLAFYKGLIGWVEDSSEEGYTEEEGYTTEDDYNKIDLLITHIPPAHMNDEHLPSASYHHVGIQNLPIPAKHWICGHQHVRTTKVIADTKVYINAGGYVGELTPPKIASFSINK